MNYYTFIVTFICVATSRVTCVSSVNSSSSVNLWKTSTASTIQEMLEVFNSLNTYQTVCSKPEYTSDKALCHEFIRENNDYFTLKQVLETKMNEVQRMLAKLMALERKAIACRGMRYLLAMNLYGAFVSYASSGSTVEADVNEEDILEDLFRTETEPNATAEPEYRNNKIDEIRKIVKSDAFPHVRNAIRPNDGTMDDRGPKAIDEHETHVRGLVRKIECIVRAVRPFFADPNDFRGLDAIEESIDPTKVDATTYRRRPPFSSVFRATNGVYARQCVPDADAAAVLGTDDVGLIARKDYTARGLLEKIDRLFDEARRDIGTLRVRCFYMNHERRFGRQDVGMMYFHAFNVYRDPAVWRLIGDETVADGRSRARTSLNAVASETARRIDRVTGDLRTSVHNGLRCKCVAYVNGMVELRYHVVRVLTANAREVQRLAAAVCARRTRVGEYVERFAKDGAHRVAATMTLDEFNGVFDEIHDALARLGVDGRAASDGDALPDPGAVSSAIDRLSRDATAGKEFRSVFFIYSMFDWFLINESVEDYQSKTNYFDVEFVSMLRDMKQTTVEVESKTVEHILKWYEWGQQVYKANCNSSIRQHIFDEKQLTLNSLISKMDALYSDLDSDMEKMSKLFHL